MATALPERRQDPDDQLVAEMGTESTNRREIVKRAGALALGGLAIVAAVRATEADDDDGGGGGSDDDGGGAAVVAAEAEAGGVGAVVAVAVATTTSVHLPAAQQICWAAGSVNGTSL